MTAPQRTGVPQGREANNRDYAEAVQRIEDHTAEMLEARDACTDLELLARSLARRGALDAQGYDAVLSRLNLIRRALELGRTYAGRARRQPVG